MGVGVPGSEGLPQKATVNRFLVFEIAREKRLPATIPEPIFTPPWSGLPVHEERNRPTGLVRG